MFSSRNADDVLSHLGSPFVNCFRRAVALARSDYQLHRSDHPDWMTTATERYLANFIHERLWARMNEQVLNEELPIQIVDKEPKREMVVPVGNANFVVRYKRHLPGDRISSYPTDGARSFWSNDDALPTMDLIPLAMGYMWHADERRIGDALISYRDRMDNPVWCIRLGEIEDGTQEITWTPVEPNLPALDLSQIVAAAEQQRGS